MSKSYSIQVAGTEVATRSAKAAAVAHAESLKGSDTVEVFTPAGNLIHTVKPVHVRAKPFTRTEKPSFEVPEREGFEVAYARVRVNAVVFRALDKDAEDRYLVLQTTTGAEFPVANTTEARKVTNALAEARRKGMLKA